VDTLGASILIDADSIPHGYYIRVEGFNDFGKLIDWLKQSLDIRSPYFILKKSDALLVVLFASIEKTQAVEYLNSVRINKYNFALIRL